MAIQKINFNTISTYNTGGANSAPIKLANTQAAIQMVDNEGSGRIYADFNPYHSWGIYHNNPDNKIEFTRESQGVSTALRTFIEPGPSNSLSNTAVMATVHMGTGVFESTQGVSEPYAVISDGDGQVFAQDTWTTINYSNGVVRGKNITVSGTGNPNIYFARRGVYFCNFGMRLGAGGDVWTGFRVLKNGTEIAISYGTGQVATNDPGPVMWNAIFVVDDVTVPYSTQVYRGGSALTSGTPAAGPAYNLTVFRMSSYDSTA